MSENARSTLKNQIDICDWQALIPHFTRGVIVIIDSGLELIEVGISISEDNTKYIKQLMDEGKIINANDDHHKKWLNLPKQKFNMIVVAPYVLIQEILAN